jgi:hypothetical protein
MMFDTFMHLQAWRFVLATLPAHAQDITQQNVTPPQ